jgi:hypothetical protein
MINYDCGGFKYTYHIWSRRQLRKCCDGGMRGLLDGLLIIMGDWIMNGMNSGTIVERFPRNGVEGKMKWE